jgi:hypothetical protein
MKKGTLALLFFLILASSFLTTNFYRNGWGIVEPVYYEYWQAVFDRTVVARIVKTRQDGFLSAGGLLGLGDTNVWSSLNRVNTHQYDVYKSNGKFKTYSVYTSTPGFPGLIFGVFDKLTNFPENTKLKIFRAGEAFASAIVLALISVWFIAEFGWLAGLLPIVLSSLSDALIRPAGSIFWNLWVFYLPMITGTILLADDSKKQTFSAGRLLWALYFLCLFKILMNGFEAITTVMIMTTVPFIYYAILDNWNWKVLLERTVKLGIVLSTSVATGLLILAAQIMVSKGSFSDSVYFIWDAFNRRAIGNPEKYGGALSESMSASILEVIWKYLTLNAFVVHISEQIWHITYLHLFTLFFLFSLVFFILYKWKKPANINRKGWALTLTTWYSILAPLSWFIVFKPNAFLHTSIYAMLWYMPFTLLGLALCGFVLSKIVFVNSG